MRKVVTGDQVAQIATGTRWRSRSGGRRCTGRRAGSSPSRSCAGSSCWLVRLVVRHPVVSLVLAVLGFTWSETGWLGVTLLVIWAVLVLVCWRVLWPVSFARRVGCSGAQHVAGVAVPAPVGVGDDDLRAGPVVSGPDHPAGARQGPLHPLRRPGPGPARVRPVRRRRSPTSPTTWRTGSARSSAASAPPKSGAVLLEFVRRDALAQVVPPAPVRAYPDLRALEVGRREDGLPWLVRLHGTHVLVAGATGAGKASLLWGLVRAMSPLMHDGLVRVLAADPKLMELAFGRIIFDTHGDYAADPAAIADMLDRAVADMQRRAARFAGYQRDHTPTVRRPVHRGAGG